MRKKVVTIICCLLVALVWGGFFANNYLNSKIGLELVTNLYNYDPSAVLAQDEALKKILSDEMYRLYTIGSDQRQLRVYLKLQGETTTVDIISLEKGRIIYSLNCSTIDPERTFQLEYKTLGWKVVDVNESELFFLPPSDREFFK